MELEGTIQNGVAVPDGECSLPEGTKVRIAEVSNRPAPTLEMTLSEKLLRLAEECERRPSDLPTDLSINHDHYLYGTPKQQP